MKNKLGKIIRVKSDYASERSGHESKRKKKKNPPRSDWGEKAWSNRRPAVRQAKEKNLRYKANPKFSSLGEIFEFSQMKLPFGRDARSIFEKQGERIGKFRAIARKRKMKNPDDAGERMYNNWRKKHDIKHDEGGFKSILGNIKK